MQWTKTAALARDDVLLGGSPEAVQIQGQSVAVLPGVREVALGVVGRAQLILSWGDCWSLCPMAVHGLTAGTSFLHLPWLDSAVMEMPAAFCSGPVQCCPLRLPETSVRKR